MFVDKLEEVLDEEHLFEGEEAQIQGTNVFEKGGRRTALSMSPKGLPQRPASSMLEAKSFS